TGRPEILFQEGGTMRTDALVVRWFGGVRLTAKAVVIGAVALACGTAHVTQAGINVWTSHGPYGGVFTALAIDPTTPSTLYAGTGYQAGTGGGGVYKSTDGGGTWSAVNGPTGLSGFVVDALAIDPSTPSTLYAGTGDPEGAGTGNGVYKSTDGGGTWNAVNGPTGL